MNNKSIHSVLLFAVMFYLTISLCSCNKENPVDSNQSAYNYDSPRFDWQVTRLPGGEWIYDLWSPDTNEVFMTSWYNHLLHFKDGQITQMNYGTNIFNACIDGLNKNEGYMAGGEMKEGKYIPHIEKWNGNSFSNVPINYSFDVDFQVSHFLVKSSNEMWISSPKGLIYNFDGYNLTLYRLPDTNLISLDIINFENNRIRYIGADFDSIITKDKYFVYEFDGNNWSKVHENKGIIFYGAINNMIYAYDLNIIFKLQNNVLIEKANIPKYALINVITGNTFENIMGFGLVNGKLTFFHWNGQRWSNENIGNNYTSGTLTRKMINDNYFCTVNSGVSVNIPILYRAYKKNN